MNEKKTISRKRKSMRLPNKYGGVVFLGERRRRPYGARITAGWTEDNKQMFKYIGYFEKREEALACLADFYRSPYDVGASKITFAELFRGWSEAHEQNVVHGTMKVYKAAFRKLESIHSLTLPSIRTAHLQPLLSRETHANAKNMKLIVGIVFREGIKREIVKEDISSLLDLPKKGESKTKKPFTKEEIDLMWEHVGRKEADMILILLYTGMRVSELFELKTENIDFERRVMIGGMKSDAGIDRMIAIHRRIEPIMKRVIGEKYLFTSPRGKKYLYSNEGYHLNKFMKAMGLDHTMHETRHTFISQCDRLGLNKVSVKKMVGHSTGKDLTEDVYTHKNADDLVGLIDAFDY